MSIALPPGDHFRNLQAGGRERSYWIHVPAIVPSGPSLAASDRRFPIVLAFHGGASNGQAMRRFSGLDEKADAAGFVTVYPNGTGEAIKPNLLTWNGGNCCGYAYREQIDDVGFVRLLLDDLAAVVPVDPARIFATGMSNGAMMAYRLAAELSDRIAAIGPVAGPMGLERCNPTRPVSVIHFHGTLDEFAPLEGGVGRRSVTGVSHQPVAQAIQAWVAANGCPPEPETTALPDRFDDGTHVLRHVYGPGRDGSEVVLYVIHGGGHTWPGQMANTFLFGKSTRNLIANDALWDFFERHPLTGGTA